MLYCGAEIDFVDIDRSTYNLSVVALEEKLKNAVKSGKLPKAVIPVHFAGQSCDMAAISRLAKQYDFYVIEDAAHAISGSYQGKNIGCCEYSDLTVFSFHPVKIITTGEGGMVLTNNGELHQKIELLRGHGIVRDEDKMAGGAGHWYYQQIDLRYNYRMTDLQAALGLSQLQRIDQFAARRRELAKRYDQELAGLPLQLPWQHDDIDSAWHLYVVLVAEAAEGGLRDRLFVKLRQRGIGVHVHYIPVHTQPYYQQLGFRTGDFPEAEKYYKKALSLPLYFDLTERAQDQVIEIMREELG